MRCGTLAAILAGVVAMSATAEDKVEEIKVRRWTVTKTNGEITSLKFGEHTYDEKIKIHLRYGMNKQFSKVVEGVWAYREEVRHPDGRVFVKFCWTGPGTEEKPWIGFNADSQATDVGTRIEDADGNVYEVFDRVASKSVYVTRVKKAGD